jgi:hypothetical protein
MSEREENELHSILEIFIDFSNKGQKRGAWNLEEAVILSETIEKARKYLIKENKKNVTKKVSFSLEKTEETKKLSFKPPSPKPLSPKPPSVKSPSPKSLSPKKPFLYSQKELNNKSEPKTEKVNPNIFGLNGPIGSEIDFMKTK